jgi:DNA repair protein RadC
MKAHDVDPTPARRPPRYLAISAPPPPIAGRRIATARDVFDRLPELRTEGREHFVTFALNVRHHVIAQRILAIGSLTGVEVHPREIFRQAIIDGAAALIVSHNHPSGDPSPSRQDIELTGRLREVAEVCGISLLDHVIVGGEGFVSLAERGWR